MNAKFHGIDVEVRKIVGDEAVIYPIPTQGLGLYHNAIKVPAAELEFDASEDDMEAIHNYIVAAEAGDLASLQYGDKWLGEAEADAAEYADFIATREDARF